MQHEYIAFRTANANVWTLNNADHSVEATVGGQFQLDSVGLNQRLTALDQGIAVLLAEFVAEDVAQGRLLRVLPVRRGQQSLSTR